MRYVSFIPILLFFLPSLASAAIAFDTRTSIANATNPSATVTRGTGASNYVGVVIILASGASRTSSGCTWGGSGMTTGSDYLDTLVGASAHAYVFYITGIPSGAQTVSCTTTAAYSGVAFTFSGVDQAAPVDTNFGGASVKDVTNTGTSISASSAMTLTGTTHVNNSVLVGSLDFTVNLPTGGTNTTVDSGGAGGYNTAPQASSGSQSVIYTNPGPGLSSESGAAIALQPPSAAAPTIFYGTTIIKRSSVILYKSTVILR